MLGWVCRRKSIPLAAVVCLAVAPPALAFDESDLQRLADTGACAECDLSFADLEGASLAGADLSGADLVCARLAAADLMGADLSGANAMGADFAGADLSGADLRRAVLLRTALLEATRANVNISGATFFRSMSDGGLAGVDCDVGAP